MDKQPIPVKETPEELQFRRDQSESQYMRDMAFSQSMDEWRCREGKGWQGGF